ncbi:hypothetical protein HDK64DRAFT_73193 [Phyllosticta capitalensis]
MWQHPARHGRLTGSLDVCRAAPLSWRLAPNSFLSTFSSFVLNNLFSSQHLVRRLFHLRRHTPCLAFFLPCAFASSPFLPISSEGNMNRGFCSLQCCYFFFSLFSFDIGFTTRRLPKVLNRRSTCRQGTSHFARIIQFCWADWQACRKTGRQAGQTGEQTNAWLCGLN